MVNQTQHHKAVQTVRVRYSQSFSQYYTGVSRYCSVYDPYLSLVHYINFTIKKKKLCIFTLAIIKCSIMMDRARRYWCKVLWNCNFHHYVFFFGLTRWILLIYLQDFIIEVFFMPSIIKCLRVYFTGMVGQIFQIKRYIEINFCWKMLLCKFLVCTKFGEYHFHGWQLRRSRGHVVKPWRTNVVITNTKISSDRRRGNANCEFKLHTETPVLFFNETWMMSVPVPVLYVFLYEL